MTDRNLAWLALAVAGVALAVAVLHALTRDTSNGGIAHSRGFTSGSGGLPSFDWTRRPERWRAAVEATSGVQRAELAPAGARLEPGTITPRRDEITPAGLAPLDVGAVA